MTGDRPPNLLYNTVNGPYAREAAEQPFSPLPCGFAVLKDSHIIAKRPPISIDMWVVFRRKQGIGHAPDLKANSKRGETEPFCSGLPLSSTIVLARRPKFIRVHITSDDHNCGCIARIQEPGVRHPIVSSIINPETPFTESPGCWTPWMFGAAIATRTT